MVKGNFWIHYQLAYDVFKVLNVFKELIQLCLTGRSSGFFRGQQPVGSRVGFLCCGGVDSFGFVGTVVGFAGRSGLHLRCWSGGVLQGAYFVLVLCLQVGEGLSVVFLDCTIIRENDRLHTNLHVKDTATHSYVRAESCHPRHIIQKGPYSQFLRLRRNCYKDADFEKHAADMIKHYKNRGYKEDAILRAYEKAKLKSHHDLIHMRKTTRLKSGWGFGQTNSPLSTARVLIDAVGLCLLRVSEVWRLFGPDLRRSINSFSGSDFEPRLVYKVWYFCYFFTNFGQQFKTK